MGTAGSEMVCDATTDVGRRYRQRLQKPLAWLRFGTNAIFLTTFAVAIISHMASKHGAMASLLTLWAYAIGIAIRRWRHCWALFVAYLLLFTILDIQSTYFNYGVTCAAGFLLYAPHVLYRTKRRTPFLLCISGIAWLLTMRHIDWVPVKPFYRAYERLEIGMHFRCVHRLFRDEFEKPVLRQCETFYGGIAFAFDKEEDSAKSYLETIFIEIEFKGERVVSKNMSHWKYPKPVAEDESD
jgi:hypothetical protein